MALNVTHVANMARCSLPCRNYHGARLPSGGFPPEGSGRLTFDLRPSTRCFKPERFAGAPTSDARDGIESGPGRFWPFVARLWPFDYRRWDETWNETKEMSA